MALFTVQDMRNEGLSSEDATDAQILRAIPIVNAFLYIATRQFFEPKTYDATTPLKLDGSGTPILHLPVPVVRLASVSEYGNDVPIANLVVYNREFPDDRFNPKIVKQAQTTLGFGGVGVYYGGQATFKAATWSRGYQNVQLTGVFGFVEPDGVSPPPAIKKTAMRILLRGWRNLCDALEAQDRMTGVITSESTDGHSYSLSGTIFGAGLTGDPAIDDVLAMYKRRFGGTTGGVGW